MRPSWLDREPGFRAFAGQLRRNLSRGFCLPLRTICASLILASLVVGVHAIKERKYAPRFVLRAVEADVNVDASPRPKRKLREHIRDAVFSERPLMEIMQRHGLYGKLMRANPRAALDSFREDIEIEVYRNYFLEERSNHEPPRSARIALSYKAEDPRTALEVTRELGDLIERYEGETRRRQAELASETADTYVKRAQEGLVSVQRQLADVSVSRDQARPPNAVKAVNLRRSMESMEMLVAAYERRRAALDVGRAYEERALGLTFDAVDRGAVLRSAALEIRDLALVGLLTVILTLPLMMVGMGAFDGRVWDAEDVRRLGLEPLALVPMQEQKRTMS
jgi:hypothetical protein